jgi:dTMP kinase
MDPAAGLARAGMRSPADRLEQESLDFHNRVRQAFRVFAEEKPQRYLVVDGTYPADKIAEIVRRAVSALLIQRRPDSRQRALSADRGTMPS